MADDNGSSQSTNSWLGIPFRDSLAALVIGMSLAGLFILSIVVIGFGENQDEQAQYVFGAVLPLIGTWVGTLLAFYYTKENFESASKAVRDMAGVTGMEKLRSISVMKEGVIIPPDQIKAIRLGSTETDANISLKDLLDHQFNRIPIMHDGQVKYMVYKDTAYRYLALLAQGKETIGKKKLPDDYTLEDLLAVTNPDSVKMMGLKISPKDLLTKSFVFLDENATLADVKRAIDRNKEWTCKDVFITQTGSEKEALKGWITDNELRENWQL